MSASSRYQVLWTETAVEMLSRVGDRRIRQQLFDSSKRLESDPEKQGKPLRQGLMGFRSLRVVGQRYRLVFSLDSDTRRVHVAAAGLRREGARDDIYALAEKLVRLGLAPSGGPRKRKAKRPKKK